MKGIKYGPTGVKIESDMGIFFLFGAVVMWTTSYSNHPIPHRQLFAHHNHEQQQQQQHRQCIERHKRSSGTPTRSQE